MMSTIIDALRSGVRDTGRTRAARPHTVATSRPRVVLLRPPRLQRTTEVINRRLEGPRRNAFGLRNLAHYRLRSLLHCGNLAQRINAL